MKQLEIEFKNMLTEKEFEQIKTYFSIKDEDFFCQENAYFDTPDFSLKKGGCALRIRKKNGTFELTLKEPHPVGLLETNEPLTFGQAKDLLVNRTFPEGEIKTRLEKLHIETNEIVHFGTLKTYRAEFPYSDGLAVLDKSFYLKKTDYELEYEVTDPKTGEQQFLQLLRLFSIPKRKTENKIVRFYKEKARQASREKLGDSQ